MNNGIDWASLYKSFPASVAKHNCISLCKPTDGIPVCCKNNRHVPLLLKDELRWHEKIKSGMWRERPIRTKLDKKQAEETLDYLKYCLCPGVKLCKRSYRSLSCRFFPFEPYFSEEGDFVGITYMYRAGKDCPLVDNDSIKIRKAYVRQAIKAWELIFDAYPEDAQLYYDESRKLQRKFKKMRRTIKVFFVGK
jgi:hypothetical protein